MNKKYTKKQITESIVKWSSYMLENQIATEDEVRDIIGEGLMRRAISAVKRFGKNAKQFAHDINWLPLKAIDKVFKPNKGVEKMKKAVADIEKDGKIAPNEVGVYAKLGSKNVYPVKLFLMRGKSKLVLIIDKADMRSMPKTLADLKDAITKALTGGSAKKKINISDAIDGIYVAEVPKETLSNTVLFESKLTDFIEKNELSKEDALKPATIEFVKALKIMKQSSDTIKSAIEEYFDKKASSEDDELTSADETSDEESPDAEDKDAEDEETSTEDVSEPIAFDAKDKKEDKKEYKKEDKKDKKKAKNPALTLLDNTLLDVRAHNGNIGFLFSKSKAEIQLDKQQAEMWK